MSAPLPDGTVYTETLVYTAPERYAAEAPYQIAIVNLPELGKRTVRILREQDQPRVKIGGTVRFKAYRDGIPCFVAAPVEDKGNT